MRIMCDWDLCVAPTDKLWAKWLGDIDGNYIELPKDKTAHYDLSKYYPNFEKDHGIKPHSYWDNPHLYDTMGSVPGAAAVLYERGASGDKMSVGSVTKGGHISSKFRHVKRTLNSFDFDTRGSGNGFFATKEKYLLPCDVAIDDRAENLLMFPDNVLKIYLNTIYMDDSLEELKTKANVIVTSIEHPWMNIRSVLRSRF